MTTLGSIPEIGFVIKTGALKTIKILHKVIFGHEGQPRQTRKNLQTFCGFNLDVDSEYFKDKVAQVKQLDLIDLTAICHILYLDYSGDAETVAGRICTFLNDLEKHEENRSRKSEDEESEDEQDERQTENKEDDGEEVEEWKHSDEMEEEIKQIETDSVYSRNSRVHQNNNKSFTLTFRDVEDTIRQFDGKGSYPIGKWIEEFEDLAHLTGWNDLQKLIYAKKSLTGMAKLLVQSEKGITSWNTLKRLLVKEFMVKTSSAEVHKMLMQRKKRKEESVQEYVLKMREIGSRADIDAEAVIQYIIDGISDIPSNKIVLYGAKSFVEFKEKARLYETIRAKSQTFEFNPKSKPNSSKYNKSEKPNRSEEDGKNSRGESSRETRHCYNCGQKGHQSRDCPSKQKGTKCFNCNNFGHVSKNCPKHNNSKAEKPKPDAEIHLISKNNLVDLRIDDITIKALFDTGSDICTVREDVYGDYLKDVELQENSLTLTGLGGCRVNTMGSFMRNVTVADEEVSLTFHVVPYHSSSYEAIIGREILTRANVTITKDGLSIHKNEPDNFMMHIDLISEEDVIDVQHIKDKTIKREVIDMVENYKPNKTEDAGIEMKVLLHNEEPIYDSPRRLPLAERKEVEKQVEEWLKAGIVRPSNSDFASPIVLVRKKDNSYRMCIDYRKLNKKVIKDRFPLPLIDDILDKLHSATTFSTIDLKNGFFHVPIEEQSRKYTSFVTHHGQFEFCRVPFGLCNSPSVFQRFIYKIFRPLMNQDIAIPYMDDIIIPSKDEKEGMERLKVVLDVASRFGLQPKFKKCQFLKQNVEFLGHRIENGTISPSKEKTAAIIKFPIPRSLKQVQSFLGLTGYFRKFVPGYSTIAKPISDLLRHGSTFVWGICQRQAFEQLKKLLTTEPVLKIYKPDARTELHVDASKYGFGATLLQEGDDRKLHPVHYMSCKTTSAQEKLPSYELEVLAIIEAVKKFRIYLLGIEFKIVTDCEAFTKTLQKKDLTTRVARWALFLEDFNYIIEHRSGTRMKHVDALSRYPILTVNVIENTVSRKIQAAQLQDPSLKAIIKILESEPYEDYVMENGVLCREQNGLPVLVIPKGLQNEIIRHAHEPGHFSVKKTEDLISKDYYIHKLHKKVEDYISACVPCILGNRKEGKQEGLLNPIPKIAPLDTYHLDHCGPFESTNKNYKYIFLVMDSFSKFVWIFPTKTLNTPEVLSKLTLLQAIFGNPRRIVTDRGGAFRSHDFEAYCEHEGIKHIQITTGVPRGNGQIENMVKTVTSALRRLSSDDPHDWYKHVSRLQQAINSTCCRSTNFSPFKIMFGIDMRQKENVNIAKILEEISEEVFDEERNDLREEARRFIEKTQCENKKGFNKKRKKAVKYNSGDIIAIKRTQFGSRNKLYPKFLGPYKVTAVKGNDRYDVERIGKGDGPKITSTSADNMKEWKMLPDDEDSSSEADERQDGRDVGIN